MKLLQCARVHYSFWAYRAIVKKKVDAKTPIATKLADDLPPVLNRPEETSLTALPNFDKNNCQFVVFDLETTGLQRNSEICQIATLRKKHDSDELWSTYILPTVAIDPGASIATGLVVKYAGNNRYLSHAGRLVKTCSSRDGMMSFYFHLQELSEAARHTILVGYRSKGFDVHVLFNNFQKFGITGDKLDELGVCFTDSYSILKTIFTARTNVNTSPKSATLSNIYENIFEVPFQAHNAANDVRALSRILFNSHCKPLPELLISQATTAGSAFDNAEFVNTKSKLLNTMNNRLFSNINTSLNWPLTPWMAKKTAASGLDYDEIKRVYEKWGKAGIDALCKMKSEGSRKTKSYRITNDQKVIEAICRHFEENSM